MLPNLQCVPVGISATVCTTRVSPPDQDPPRAKVQHPDLKGLVMLWNPPLLPCWRRLLVALCLAGSAALLLGGCDGGYDPCTDVNEGACSAVVWYL